MTLEFPALSAKLQGLHSTLTMFSFFILTVGLIKKVSSVEINGVQMIKPLVMVMMLTLIIANARDIFNGAQKFFLDIAEDIKPGYREGPLASAVSYMESTDAEKKNFIESLFTGGVYQSIFLAIGKILIHICRGFQLPLLAIQYFLVRTAYIAAPVILPFFMFRSMSQVASRFIFQTLTIMAWPIGFAVTNMMVDKMLDSFANPMIAGNVFGNVSGSVVGNMQAALLAALVAGTGTVLTPFVMHTLFAAGAGLVESTSSALMIGKGAGMKAVSMGKGLKKRGYTAAKEIGMESKEIMSEGVQWGRSVLNKKKKPTPGTGVIRHHVPVNSLASAASPKGYYVKEGFSSDTPTKPSIPIFRPSGDRAKEVEAAIRRQNRMQSILSDV